MQLCWISYLTRLCVALSHLCEHNFLHKFWVSLNHICDCGKSIKTAGHCLSRNNNFIVFNLHQYGWLSHLTYEWNETFFIYLGLYLFLCNSFLSFWYRYIFQLFFLVLSIPGRLSVPSLYFCVFYVAEK